MKLYLRNEICSDEKMLLRPSDRCGFGNYKSAKFLTGNIHNTLLLKNNRNYTKTVSMKINNKRKYSFLIKQLTKSDVEIYCVLFSALYVPGPSMGGRLGPLLHRLRTQLERM